MEIRGLKVSCWRLQLWPLLTSTEDFWFVPEEKPRKKLLWLIALECGVQGDFLFALCKHH